MEDVFGLYYRDKKQSYKKAIEYFLQAAELGQVNAQNYGWFDV